MGPLKNKESNQTELKESKYSIYGSKKSSHPCIVFPWATESSNSSENNSNSSRTTGTIASAVATAANTTITRTTSMK